MIDEQIKSIVQRYCGIDLNILGSPLLQQTLRHRMLETGTARDSEYVALLTRSDDEVQCLVNELTVPETWFFRDEKPFELLAKWGSEERLHKVNSGKLLKILSVPCASGEEPYSIAITLLETGFMPGQFHIDALDINTHALALAECGIYGQKSFRSKNKHSMLYFETVENGNVAIDSLVKKTVTLWHGDVLKTPLLVQAEHYDVIFCRNLLIYFDKQTQQRAAVLLEKSLVADGLLFLGHAETNCVGTMDVVKNSPGTFCLKKRTPTTKMTRVAKSTPKSEVQGAELEVPDLLNVALTTAPVLKNLSLEAIEAVYQAGHIIEAAQYCEAFIALHPDSPFAYFILGLIRKASGNDALAESLLRKTVYLDPKHHRAMVELANMSEQQGDKQSALQWRARASRVSAND